MAKRLTPPLRRRVLELPIADRLALMGELRASIDITPGREERLSYLADKMQEVSGIDVRINLSRDVQCVWPRYIFAFVARREGFLLREIGDVLHRNHSSVSIAEKRVAKSFEIPAFYRREISLYNKYIESL